MSKIKGFSISELLIVITILGILTAISVPSYKRYKLKGKVISVVEILKGFQAQIADYHTAYGTCPDTVYFGTTAIQNTAAGGAVFTYPTGGASGSIPEDPIINIFYKTSTLSNSAPACFIGVNTRSVIGSGILEMVYRPLSLADRTMTFLCGFEYNTIASKGTTDLYLPSTCNDTPLMPLP